MRSQNVKLARLVVVGIVAAMIVGTGAFLAISHAGGLAGVQWNQIGPAPLAIDSDQSHEGSGRASGETVDVAIDPRGSTDEIIFIATEDGGVWQSTDGGSTWRTTTDFLNTLSFGALALDPGDPSIVYAGTGDPAQNGVSLGIGISFKGIGIYKSTDDGQTWALTPSTGVNFNAVRVRRIAMPNPNTLLAATGNFLARSTDGGNTFTKPTINGSTSSAIDDIHVDTAATPTSASPQTVLAAVDSAGIFVSTDSGATWGPNLWTVSNGSPLSVANFTPGFISFAQTTGPNTTIYASVQNALPACSATVLPPCASPPFWGLFVSTNSGATWSQATATGIPNCTQCGYDQTIGVDPNNAALVYLGFVDDWVSTDGGATFSIAASGTVHNDHHALVFSPHVPVSPAKTPFYDGTDGGISKFDGTNFTNINGPDPGPGQAIASNLFRDIDIGRGTTNNKYSYGGMQDTGEAQFTPANAPTTWHMGLGGDSAGTAVDPFNPMHALGMADGCLNVTTNGGSGWSQATVPNYVAGLGFSNGTTLAFDQVNSSGTDNTVYASVEVASTPPVASCFGACFGFGNGTCTGPELFRSTDGGSTYAQFASPTTYAALIDAIATAAIDPNTVWLALADGTLQVSTNATSGSPSFAAPAAQPSAAGGTHATAIAIDPTNTQTVVVTYDGLASKHVFITTNGGASWTDITANLPDLAVNAVVIDPSTSPHTIIIGNDAGVLQTADNGSTWQVLGIGMPTVAVSSLALDSSVTPEVLRAGTFGRSVFDLGAATGPLLSINSTFNFGTTCPVQTPTELLQLFNVGTSDLTISSISQVAPINSDFTLTGPSFPVTIKVGEEVDFTVSFKPKLANEGTTETATFQIDSNAVVNPTRQITYTATVGAPNGSTVIANGGNFGNVCVGSFADLNLTIANKGTCDLLVSGITSNDGDFLPPSTLVYPLAVQAGTSVAAPVRFEPLSIGTKAGIITVDSSNNPSGNMSVNVTGTASPGHITVSGSGTFGNVCSGANAQQTITVANTGSCNLHVTGASINCSDFTIEGNPFPATLSPDSSLPLTIAFTPTSIGPKSCTLTITSDDPSNPIVTVPLTATTPAVSIDVPPDVAPFGYNFPATVIQSVGACSSKNPFPVSNNGSCPTSIKAVTIGPPSPPLPGTTITPADYSLAGLPSLSTPLQPGHILGEGNLNTVFKPTLITRAESAAVTVTWESDPISHATTSVSRNLCGEGTSRGARVLVTAGGVPLTSVDKIQLHRLNSNRKSISIDNVSNAPLQTVTQTAPCASFQFQREWGGVTNPIQLTAGDYQITVTATVNNKKVSKTVSFTLETCSFNQNIVVAF